MANDRVSTENGVDDENREFYSNFPFPWPPMTFPHLADERLETVMLNQSIGDFSHSRISTDCRVWVAGCGTNQAVYTAARFPRATVIGSDLSPASLQLAASNASTMGLENLSLREESINDAGYDGEFDYIICTGVIHHNANPGDTLKRLARALKPNGVLELMVYNRFHRIFTTAFQGAMDILGRAEQSYAEQMTLARRLLPLCSTLHAPSGFLGDLPNMPEAMLADSLLQPVEFSYDVGELDRLVRSVGLRLTLPCPNQFDQAEGRWWTLPKNADPHVQDAFGHLNDVNRWQIINWLRLTEAPLLWFFVEKGVEESGCEYAANEAFLESKFVRTSTTLRNFVRGPNDLHYKPASAAVPYPRPHAEPGIASLVSKVQPDATMREILTGHYRRELKNAEVTSIRAKTTTNLYPYLTAV